MNPSQNLNARIQFENIETITKNIRRMKENKAKKSQIPSRNRDLQFPSGRCQSWLLKILTIVQSAMSPSAGGDEGDGVVEEGGGGEEETRWRQEEEKCQREKEWPKEELKEW